MASGFKTATVTAAKVPSTQTNFPAYVDLSRLGVTTQAEADSVRVYADSGKTTEWAREIVNTTEMWVKVPSLTSTTAIYVDWDGVRSDHAVTDTYGRNAVWSNYNAVFHLRAGSGTSATNSTGGSAATLTSSALWGTSTPFGSSNCITADGTNYITTGVSGTLSNYTISDWRYNINPSGTQNSVAFWAAANTFTSNSLASYYDDANPAGSRDLLREYRNTTHVLGTSAEALNAWKYRVRTSQKNTTNGAKDYSNASVVMQANTPNNDISLGTRDIYICALNNTGTVAWKLPSGNHICEWRMRLDVVSADWITTEYNNQSDESGFWGTWSTVGGGGGAVAPQFLGFAGL